MTMLYYPDNIRRFVGELTIGKPGNPAGQTDLVEFESVNPPFPAEVAFLGFLDFFLNQGKGVELVSAVPALQAENMEQ